MIVEKLDLKHFRNYRDCSFTFSPGLNFIYGDNGNGKTNILEAVSMLCFTRSFLQASDSDCLQYEENQFKIFGSFKNRVEVSSKVEFDYLKEDSKKSVKLDGEHIGRLTNFFGKIPLVVLSPLDMKLSYGTPADKRQNFDILISQISKTYLDELRSLNRVLKQKNSLLKDNINNSKYKKEELLDLIAGWNEELAVISESILRKRLEFVKEFVPYIIESFKSIVDDTAEPVFEYESEIDLKSTNLRKSIEDSLIEKLSIEIIRGVSLVGPQRDNYIFRINKIGQTFDLKYFASQGEQKTYVIALKLAEYFYLKDKLDSTSIGEPILMLDDIFSELDNNRVNRIAGLLNKFNQVFITTTNKNYLDIISNHYDKSKITAFNIINGTAQIIN